MRSRPSLRRAARWCAGSRRADSIALDPHKWLHAPFEVGVFALVRDAASHLRSFLDNAGVSRGGAAWYCVRDVAARFRTPDIRGFRALKVWMALKEHGLAKFGR